MVSVDDLLAEASRASLPEETAWMLAKPGPPLDAVTARLSSAPREFLDPGISLEALARDVVGDRRLRCLAYAGDRRVRTGAALALWLLASEHIVEPFDPPVGASGWLAVDALALRVAPVSDPLQWLSDDERREEAARTFLLRCGFVPRGEDAATARSLLAARDSLRRNAAFADAYAAQQHREEIARRLAEARAKEAAARYSSE